jgi:hypothetical protein
MPARPSLRLTALHNVLLFCALLGTLATSPFCAASSSDDWRYSETRNETREFAAGGFVHVRLSVGDMHIKRGDSTKIRLEYTVKSRRERNVKEATVDFDVHGNNATIEFHAPSSSNTEFDVELEVPANTNLDVHNKVGDVSVENVEGDKDLDLDVGDISVTASQAGYRTVRASAGIGDVNSDYGETSGWLGKTLHYRGDGKYELRAHVGVGDINLEGK